jgi:hypothetical protein
VAEGGGVSKSEASKSGVLLSLSFSRGAPQALPTFRGVQASLAPHETISQHSRYYELLNSLIFRLR